MSKLLFFLESCLRINLLGSWSSRLCLVSNSISCGDSFRPIMVGPEEIAAIASVWSGIPVQQITADERVLLLGLDEQLKKRVIGQDEAVAAISRAVKRSRVGLKDPDRPIAAMIFCGPTGVGKTELTKALAACYFGSVRLHAIIHAFPSLKSVLKYSLSVVNFFV